jgi:hypothetical protein
MQERPETSQKVKQLELFIDEARKTLEGPALIKYIIKLYGDEFDKANDEIARQRAANDELFKIKQKVVIANRGLMHDLEETNKRVVELQKENAQLRKFLKKWEATE